MNWLLSLFGLTPTDTAHLWLKKWTTWLSALQLSFVSMFGVWLTLDAELKASLPGWVPKLIAGGSLFLAFAIPAAANARQQKLNPPQEK